MAKSPGIVPPPSATTSASIVTSSVTGGADLIIVDRGTRHGVRADLPVVVWGSVVGKVVAAYGRRSKVRLVVFKASACQGGMECSWMHVKSALRLRSSSLWVSAVVTLMDSTRTPLESCCQSVCPFTGALGAVLGRWAGVLVWAGMVWRGGALVLQLSRLPLRGEVASGWFPMA